MENIIDISSMLSTLLGGIIAFLGAFIPSWIFYKKKRKDSINMIKRDKMETLLREIYSLKWWFSQFINARLIYKTKEEIDKVGEPPIGEIETLSKLYFPELESSVILLSRHYTTHVVAILKSVRPGSDPELDSSAMEVLDQHFLELLSQINNLATECRDVMANLESEKKNRR